MYAVRCQEMILNVTGLSQPLYGGPLSQARHFRVSKHLVVRRCNYSSFFLSLLFPASVSYEHHVGLYVGISERHRHGTFETSVVLIIFHFGK